MPLIGRLFKRINLPAMIDPQYPVQTERGGIAGSDTLKCYLTLLTLGKNDFEAVEGFRTQRFVHQALGLRSVPSSATLRQRLDAMGCEWSELADRINRAILGLQINGAPIDFGALSTGHIALDIDTFGMDQSDTAKEGVSWTWAGVDGYCPVALYLGTRGLTGRTIDRRGNALLLPEYVLEGWSTTLGAEIQGEQVIALYRDHATHDRPVSLWFAPCPDPESIGFICSIKRRTPH